MRFPGWSTGGPASLLVGYMPCTQIHTKPVVRLYVKRAGPARRDPAPRHPGSRLWLPRCTFVWVREKGHACKSGRLKCMVLYLVGMWQLMETFAPRGCVCKSLVVKWSALDITTLTCTLCLWTLASVRRYCTIALHAFPLYASAYIISFCGPCLAPDVTALSPCMYSPGTLRIHNSHFYPVFVDPG